LFRSWQGEALVFMFYYFFIFLVILWGIVDTVVSTVHDGVWGFFAGLLFSIVAGIVGIVIIRIGSELALAVFVARDSLSHIANRPSNPVRNEDESPIHTHQVVPSSVSSLSQESVPESAPHLYGYAPYDKI